MFLTPMFINQAENALATFVQRINEPEFNYALLGPKAKGEYHAIVAMCEMIVEKDKMR